MPPEYKECIMAPSLASIKLSADLVDAARTDAPLFSRSIGGQVEHWARLGRAIENSPAFPLGRVRAALNGEFNADALSDAEWRLFDALLPEAMAGVHTPAERAFWASFAGQANTDL
jgi:hypothetical protein